MIATASPPLTFLGQIMSEEVRLKPVRSSPVPQRIIVYAGIVLAIFLIGFVPMWLKARASNRNLAETAHQLTLVKMQSNLASAVIDARRGDYEPARQAASQFFISLGAEIDEGEASDFTKPQREGMQPLLVGRDDIITLLARSDPAAADRLSDLFVAYRKVMTG